MNKIFDIIVLETLNQDLNWNNNFSKRSIVVWNEQKDISDLNRTKNNRDMKWTTKHFFFLFLMNSSIYIIFLSFNRFFHKFFDSALRLMYNELQNTFINSLKNWSNIWKFFENKTHSLNLFQKLWSRRDITIANVVEQSFNWIYYWVIHINKWKNN